MTKCAEVALNSETRGVIQVNLRQKKQCSWKIMRPLPFVLWKGTIIVVTHSSTVWQDAHHLRRQSPLTSVCDVKVILQENKNRAKIALAGDN